MAEQQMRGLESHEELRGKDLIRDTRTIPQKIISALKGQTTFFATMIVLTILPVVEPLMTNPAFFFGVILTLHRYFAFRKDIAHENEHWQGQQGIPFHQLHRR